MRAAIIAILVLGLSGCVSLGVSEKASELRRSDSPPGVRAAASLGDSLGFFVMSPVTAVLLPITVPLVHVVDVGDPYEVILYPSLRFGELTSVAFGAPVDLVASP